MFSGSFLGRVRSSSASCHSALLLLDFPNLARRMFHAGGPNPVRALWHAWRDLVRTHKPTHVAAALDCAREDNFRLEIDSGYKSRREDPPASYVDTARRMAEVLRDGCNVPLLEHPRHEADDVLGSLAVRAAEFGVEVLIVSEDKDFGQLVDDNVRLLRPRKRRLLGPDEVALDLGVSPCRIVDLLALMGDASDSVRGVPGVGKKRALGLLEDYGSLDAILADEDAEGWALRVQEHYEDALTARDLVTIRVDLEGLDPWAAGPLSILREPDLDAIHRLIGGG